MIKIAIDAMGGDFAPEQQVKGAIEALGKSGDFSVILAGDEAALKAELSKYERRRADEGRQDEEKFLYRRRV